MNSTSCNCHLFADVLSGRVFLVMRDPTFFVLGYQHCFKFEVSQDDGTSDADSNSAEPSFINETTAYGFILLSECLSTFLKIIYHEWTA